MVNKMIPVSWILEVMSMTHSSENSATGGIIPLTNVTKNTNDISKYIGFGFYDRVWFNYNAGMYPSEPERWLGISH